MPYPTTTIGKIVKIRGGKRLPLGENLVTTKTDHPYIRGRDIRNGLITFDDPVYVTDEVFEKIKRYTVSTNDVCITIVGNIGDVGMTPPSLNGASLTENAAKLVDLPPDCDPVFLKYSLLSDKPQSQMKRFAAGAAQPKLGLYKVSEIEIPYPPFPAQRRIASILSAYDDLIENNTRRINLLELMAQAIYREWFVEFRAPGVKLRKATSEEQKVTGKDRFPVGWELKQLGDVIELAYGKALKADTRVPGQVPVYGSAGVTGYHNESLVAGPGIIVGRKGNVGSVFWSDEDFFPIDTAFYVVTELNLHYVYYNLREQNFINSDAAVPGLSRNQAYLNPFVVPSSETLSLFGEFIDPLFGQIQNLTKKNANLRQTRDMLLPRLVGGEIDVSGL